MAYPGHDKGLQSIELHGEKVLRCVLGAVVVQGDYRQASTTSGALLTMLSALWEGHFRDSGRCR